MIFGGVSAGATGLGSGPFSIVIIPRKQGGDDVPREEYWEKRKPEVIRDATLDSVIRQAYDKAMGREVAKPVQVVDAFDYETDDEDVLMLMMG